MFSRRKFNNHLFLSAPVSGGQSLGSGPTPVLSSPSAHHTHPLISICTSHPSSHLHLHITPLLSSPSAHHIPPLLSPSAHHTPPHLHLHITSLLSYLHLHITPLLSSPSAPLLTPLLSYLHLHITPLLSSPSAHHTPPLISMRPLTQVRTSPFFSLHFTPFPDRQPDPDPHRCLATTPSFRMQSKHPGQPIRSQRHTHTHQSLPKPHPHTLTRKYPDALPKDVCHRF
ncbi:unnamed protein product [Pleuronectes platessa]|uniref:Uncharacterized protein n=1 Tax=Pleuronectes platessa TaxID=8262 RepID=A0A9N7UU14_PLEPL|nr:unnamed protein product [Pleuronectes platessa]